LLVAAGAALRVLAAVAIFGSLGFGIGGSGCPAAGESHDQAAACGAPAFDRQFLGGDGTNGSPATGWPRYNRIAAQPAQWVGPGQVSWLQFQIQAPQTPGTYKLYIRPLIEGAQWMEDYGVYWVVTVK